MKRPQIFAQKFQLSFSSGDGYDIVYVDDLNQQMLMEGNYLMDITEDVKERGWLDKTVPGRLNLIISVRQGNIIVRRF